MKDAHPTGPRVTLPHPAAKLPGSNPCAACAVRDRAICAVLDDSELEQLSGLARPSDLDVGRTVFFEGDDADSLYVLIAGALKLYKLLPDGRRQITGFLFAGDFLGLAFNEEYQFTAEALMPSRLCRLPRTKIEGLLPEMPKLASRLLNLAFTELASAQTQMLLLGRKTAQERLASFLLHLADRLAGQGDPVSLIHLPMSRADIGDYLGLTVETVSRGVTKLKSAGLIALRDGNYIQIQDRPGLEGVAGDL